MLPVVGLSQLCLKTRQNSVLEFCREVVHLDGFDTPSLKWTFCQWTALANIAEIKLEPNCLRNLLPLLFSRSELCLSSGFNSLFCEAERQPFNHFDVG